MDCVALFLLVTWTYTGSILTQANAVHTDICSERSVDTGRQRSCGKPCRRDADCPIKRQCLCDGECGWSCVVPGRTCPWPLTLGPDSAAVLLSAAPSFSAIVEIRCRPSFAAANGLAAVTRRCQGNRQWSGQNPVCTAATTDVPLSCSAPDSVSGLSLEGSTTVGSAVKYSCQPGYTLVGSGENVCEANQTWRYSHPICHRVFCPPPAQVSQGYLVAVQRQEYEVGETIYYLCKKTFLLDGPNRVNCQSDGTWSSVPFCRARCAVPVQRSRIILRDKKLWPYEIPEGLVQHGENVTFYCKHPGKHCTFTAVQSCFDGELMPPPCYMEPTWLQYKLFPHRLVSEIQLCDPDDL